jgi:serine/threonine protein kinase
VHHRAGIKYLIKLASKTGILPSSLFVPGVTFGENKVLQTFGNLTDVFRATYEGTEVALKRFRVHMRNNDRLHPVSTTRVEICFVLISICCFCQKKFCREALIWRQLRHPNVLPFLGIDMLAFRPSCFVSVVLPWMHQGNLMDYILSSSYVPIIHHHKLVCALVISIDRSNALYTRHIKLHEALPTCTPSVSSTVLFTG